MNGVVYKKISRWILITSQLWRKWSNLKHSFDVYGNLNDSNLLCSTTTHFNDSRKITSNQKFSYFSLSNNVLISLLRRMFFFQLLILFKICFADGIGTGSIYTFPVNHRRDRVFGLSTASVVWLRMKKFIIDTEQLFLVFRLKNFLGQETNVEQHGTRCPEPFKNFLVITAALLNLGEKHEHVTFRIISSCPRNTSQAPLPNTDGIICRHYFSE